MFRFIVSMLWGAISAVIVYAANDQLFTNLLAGAIFSVIMGLSLWGADSLRMRNAKQIGNRPLYARVMTWFVLYELAPAAILLLLSGTGLFLLPRGFHTALAMCLPISLISLRDYVDLSWLAR